MTKGRFLAALAAVAFVAALVAYPDSVFGFGRWFADRLTSPVSSLLDSLGG